MSTTTAMVIGGAAALWASFKLGQFTAHCHNGEERKCGMRRDRCFGKRRHLTNDNAEQLADGNNVTTPGESKPTELLEG